MCRLYSCLRKESKGYYFLTPLYRRNKYNSMKFSSILVIFFALQSHAYIENPGLFPLGESESMMANTGVALKGSTGSAFFNPAGLAGMSERRISLTGNTYMSYSSETKPVLSLDGHDLDFRATGLQAVPSSLVSTFSWNSWTVALAVFVPSLVKSNELISYSTTNFEMQLSQMVDLQLMMLGFAMGTPTSKGADFGWGCYLSNYQRSLSVSFIAQPKQGSGLTHAGVSNTYRTMDVKSLMCSAGLQGQWSETTRWGFSLHLPSFPLSGSGQHYSFQQDTSNNRSSTGAQRKSARYDHPTQISFGFAHAGWENFDVLADVTYQFPQNFELLEGTAEVLDTRSTLRWSLGAAYRWSERLRLRGGFAYNPSAVNIKTDGDSKEDYQTLTAGAEIIDKTTTMGMAIFSTQSRGENRISATQKGSLTTKATALILTTGFIF